MKEKKIDILITSYNRNEILKKILEVLSNQTENKFNLIINDDGSNQLIDTNNYPIITKYIWNKDDGYHRVARIMESIKLSVSPKIIILDDDCVPNSEKFVETYVKYLDEYDILQGKLLMNGKINGHFFSTANLGFTRKFYENNGFYDEYFDGSYGYEDVDLGLRVENNKKIKFKRNFHQDSLVKHGVETYKNGDRSHSVIGRNLEYLRKKWKPHGYEFNMWGEVITN